MSAPARVIAIDWSGALSGAERHIWLAEVREGDVVRLECGRSRETIASFLVADVARDPRVAIGLDFAFSLPAWFLEARGLGSALELWELVEREGERWMAECAPPFWGRPGRRRPDGIEHFRRADVEVPAVGGIRPKSVFQIGGAGAVGTGSLRGMPMLRTLRDAGIAVWPFDAPSLPVAMEIYPRWFTGAVLKRAAAARAAYLEAMVPSMSAEVRLLAVGSEDAFDAVLSALAMDAAFRRGAILPPARDAVDHLEGRIWLP